MKGKIPYTYDSKLFIYISSAILNVINFIVIKYLAI